MRVIMTLFGVSAETRTCGPQAARLVNIKMRMEAHLAIVLVSLAMCHLTLAVSRSSRRSGACRLIPPPGARLAAFGTGNESELDV